MPTILIIALSVLALALAVLGIVRGLIRLCQPNEVLVISGSRRRVGDRKVGYRLVQGGRGFVVPLLETVDRLDLTNMIIDIHVRGAYSKGGIPLDVQGVANVKIASSEPVLGNAIERFLGKAKAEIMKVARETLEGNLRGVLATLTPEEVNQDRVKFAQSLLHEAGEDLRKLGLVLDTLKIQHVSDDRGYLDSIGRKQSADLQKRSRVAEAESWAESMERDAENFEAKEQERIVAEMASAKAQAAKQVADAETRLAALVAEQQAEVTALVAKARAELEVQQMRIEQTRLRLQADVVAPASAERDARVARAEAKAAAVIEEGRATASALRTLGKRWQQAGPDARRIFVAQKVGTLVRRMLETVADRPVDKVTLIDPAIAGRDDLGSKATVAARLLQATGTDLGSFFGRASALPRGVAGE
jgi:flotillin